MDFAKSKSFLLATLMLNVNQCSAGPFDQEPGVEKTDEGSEADKSGPQFFDVVAATILSSRMAEALSRYSYHNQLPVAYRAFLGDKAPGFYMDLSSESHKKFGVGFSMELAPLLYALVAALRGEDMFPELQKSVASFGKELNKLASREIKDVITPFMLAIKACQVYEEHAERVEMIYRAMEAKAIAEGRQFGSQMVEVEGDRKDAKARYELEFNKVKIIEQGMQSKYSKKAIAAIKACSIRPLEVEVRPNLEATPVSTLEAKAELASTFKKTTIFPKIEVGIGCKSSDKNMAAKAGNLRDCVIDVWEKITGSQVGASATCKITLAGATDYLTGYSATDYVRAQLADAKALSLMQRQMHAAECQTQRTRFKDLEEQKSQMLRIFDDSLLSWNTGASQEDRGEYPLSHVLDVARKVQKISMEEAKAAVDYQKALFEMRAEEGEILPDWANKSKTKAKASKVPPKKGNSGSLIIN